MVESRKSHTARRTSLCMGIVSLLFLLLHLLVAIRSWDPVFASPHISSVLVYGYVVSVCETSSGAVPFSYSRTRHM